MKIKKILLNKYFIFFVVCSFSFLAYISNGRYTGASDTRINEEYALRIAQRNKLYLDKPITFELLLKTDELDSQAKWSYDNEGKYYSKYPIATSLLAYPFFKAASILGVENYTTLGKILAASLTALSLGILFLALRKITRIRYALLIVLIYGFATSTWPLSAQALWQHTWSQLFSIISIYLVLTLWQIKERKLIGEVYFYKINICRGHLIMILALALALVLSLNIAVRLTNFFAAAIIGSLVFILAYRKTLLPALIISSIPVLLLLFYNKIAFDSFFATGYSSEAREGWNSPFLQGFWGLLFSPSVGIIIISPILLFALWGTFLALKNFISDLKNKKFEFNLNTLFAGAALVFIINLLVYSKWWAWSGDAWAYRMLLDALPFLILLLIIPVEYIFSNLKKVQGKILLTFFTIFLGFSIYVQFLGAFAWDFQWQVKYKVNYDDRDYLFDWDDSQLAYYITKQRYYLFTPNRNIFVVGDKFGNEVDFDNDDILVSGETSILHAVDLTVGRTSYISDGDLILPEKFDGITLGISKKYKSEELKLTIQFAGDANVAPMLKVNEIVNGSRVEAIDYPASGILEITIDEGAEELRLYNNSDSESIIIDNISVTKN